MFNPSSDHVGYVVDKAAGYSLATNYFSQTGTFIAFATSVTGLTYIYVYIYYVQESYFITILFTRMLTHKM
jgi:hypothetical protein